MICGDDAVLQRCLSIRRGCSYRSSQAASDSSCSCTGRNKTDGPQMAAGLLLMAYPYFATSLVSLVATGAVIGLILWYAIRLGW